MTTPVGFAGNPGPPRGQSPNRTCGCFSRLPFATKESTAGLNTFFLHVTQPKKRREDSVFGSTVGTRQKMAYLEKGTTGK